MFQRRSRIGDEQRSRTRENDEGYWKLGVDDVVGKSKGPET